MTVPLHSNVMIGQRCVEVGHGNLRHVTVQAGTGRVDFADNASGAGIRAGAGRGTGGLVACDAFLLVERGRLLGVPVRVMAGEAAQAPEDSV